MVGIDGELYDAITAEKDYAAEAEAVARAITAVARRPVRSLLDVACGTGRHLEHLRKRYDEVVGLDLEPAWLAVAARRLPGVKLVQGDMLDLDLGRGFDAVTCLFSSIGYVQTSDNLGRAVGHMSRHLAPGGVLVVEPFIAPERFTWGHVSSRLVETPALKIARFTTTGELGPVARMTFHYLVGRDGVVRYSAEEHALALFTKEQLIDAFLRAGLVPSYDEKGISGRGLVVGVSPDDVSGAARTR